MSWVLRITNTVPVSGRLQYLKEAKRITHGLTQNPRIKHLGSYRVAFGNALEFMHLFEFESLKDYEETHVPEVCQEMKDIHGSLVEGSRWEWLKPLEK